MKIIQGRAGSGTSNELLRLFLQDGKRSSFITDELTLKAIFLKTQYLQNEFLTDVVDLDGKVIITGMFTNCQSDYYLIVRDCNTESIYLDLNTMPTDFRESFVEFCLDIEREYGLNIVMIERLNASSETEGINIILLGEDYEDTENE